MLLFDWPTNQMLFAPLYHGTTRLNANRCTGTVEGEPLKYFNLSWVVLRYYKDSRSPGLGSRSCGISVFEFIKVSSIGAYIAIALFNNLDGLKRRMPGEPRCATCQLLHLLYSTLHERCLSGFPLYSCKSTQFQHPKDHSGYVRRPLNY